MWGSGDRRTKREPIPYICDFSRGLGAKVGCERFHANIQPAATKTTNMVYLSFRERLLACGKLIIISQHIISTSHYMFLHGCFCRISVMCLDCLQNFSMFFYGNFGIVFFRNHITHRKSIPKF